LGIALARVDDSSICDALNLRLLVNKIWCVIDYCSFRFVALRFVLLSFTASQKMCDENRLGSNNKKNKTSLTTVTPLSFASRCSRGKNDSNARSDALPLRWRFVNCFIN
jgi:hypothetical protein